MNGQGCASKLNITHHRHRKMFLSMGAQLNENKICVAGDVVLFMNEQLT